MIPGAATMVFAGCGDSNAEKLAREQEQKRLELEKQAAREQQQGNKAVSDIDFADMRRYFDLYNIGWILVHSDTSKRYFDSMPGIVALDSFREIKTYRVDRPLFQCCR